jgi:hypothetical protein
MGVTSRTTGTCLAQVPRGTGLSRNVPGRNVRVHRPYHAGCSPALRARPERHRSAPTHRSPT